jgi:hypothetical protein
VTEVAAVPLVQLPFPSHDPALHGVPSIAGAHCPELALHWVDRHSVPPQFGVPVHAPARQLSELAKTQRFPSAHSVPFGTVGVEHWPLAGSHVPATWHWSEAAQVTVLPAVQDPATQVSFRSHAFPSLQVVPSATVGFEQTPVDGLHVPAAWHWSDAVQVTVLPAVQDPATQVSFRSHAFPSLHAVPSAMVGFEQTPVDGSQVPATWHWSEAVQVVVLPAVQAPATHVSFRSQTFPSLHAVPSATVGFEHSPVDGLHAPAA